MHYNISTLPKEYIKLYEELKKGNAVILDVSKEVYSTRKRFFDRFRLVTPKTCNYSGSASMLDGTFTSCFIYLLNSKKRLDSMSHIEKIVYLMWRYDKYENGSLFITNMQVLK